MNMRKFFCSLLSVVLFSLILFSGVSTVKASAISLPSGGHYMTVSDTLQFIGSEIPVTYYNGSDYVTTSALYNSSVTPNFTEFSENPVDFVTSGNWLVYTFTASSNTSPNFITVSLQPTYSLFDTTCVFTTFALSRPSSISSSTYQSPQCNWYIAGSIHNFYNSSNTTSSSGSYSYLHRDYYISGHRDFSYIPVSFSSQSTFSAYAVDCAFYGNGKGISDNSYVFLVQCPYVSSGSSGGSGSFTTAATTGTTSGGSSTDLTETNGLISGVISAIGNAVSSVLDGIAGLFVPDDEFLEDWVDGMKTLLSDHLGGLYQAIDLLTDFYDVYQGVTAKQSIHVDTVSVPLAGTSFTLGGWDMPLKVTGLPAVLYDGIAYIVDFLAVMMFLKMCRNKLEIILNPDSEVVQNDN